MIEIMKTTELNECESYGSDTTLALRLSPDQVRVGDFLPGGYEITSVSYEAQHDNQPATRMTLSDSLANREVGRLVLLNDALRDASLMVYRLFLSPEARQDFVTSVHYAGKNPPRTGTLHKARQIGVGDYLWVMGDDSEDPAKREWFYVPVISVQLRTHQVTVPGGIVVNVETALAHYQYMPDEPVWTSS